MPSSVANPREPTVGQPNPTASAGENSLHQATAGATGSSSSIRPSEVRVIPLGTVVAAVPAPGGRAPPSNSSRGSTGLFYPVLARVHHANSENLNGPTRVQVSDEPRPQGVNTARQSILNAASQERNNVVPRADGNPAITLIT